ncbi:MAG: 3-beta hydroxysteroid dehydrogenase [Bacteroidetes bacterium]|nr:MAG: 3-beta hydroxysteroid dehydrogenase [Bacteroidota bacterium]
MAIANDLRPGKDHVLVTGGTGFLGAYILQALVEKGYSVTAIRRSNKIPFFIDASVLDKVDWVDGDVLDVDKINQCMRGVSAVVHAAAKVSFDSRERSEMYRTNVEGTANVVNCALQNNIQKLLHVSSVAALGRNENQILVNEGKEWEDTKLQSHYASSKYHAEMEVWRAVAEGLNAVVINPSTVLGFGDWNLTSCALFKSVYHEFPWYTNGITGFVDVRDIAKAAVLMLENDVSAERFLLSGENWSYRQLFNCIADGFQKKHPAKEATPFMGGLAWRWEKLKSLFTGITPLLTKESARIAQYQVQFDNSKMHRFFPEFVFTPLQDTIQQACQLYLANRQ